MPRNIIAREVVKPHKGDDHPTTPFLYIRSLIPSFNDLATTFDDLGSRPFQGSNWISYLSPAITIDGDQIVTDLTASQSHSIAIEVKNGGGISVTNAFLDMYWSYPTTVFSTNSCTHIGNTQFIDVPSYSTNTKTFSWTPPILGMFPVHCCLLTRVQSFVPDDHSPNQGILYAVDDRHVAQKNIHVIEPVRNIVSFGFIFGSTIKGGSYKIQTQEIIHNKQIDHSTFGKLLKKGRAFAKTNLNNITLHGGDKINDVKAMDPKSFGLLGSVKEARVMPNEFRIEKQEELRHGIIILEKNPRDNDMHIVLVNQLDIKTSKVVGGFCLIF